MENIKEASQKLETELPVGSSNFATEYVFKGIHTSMLKKHLYTHIYCSSIHNSRYGIDLGIHQWMDKENVVHMYTMKYYLATKE
jgi:hypothetical protein